MNLHPKVIQGGMGVNISNPRLAKAVSIRGQQGTISGVALEKVMPRILQMGDLGGHLRRALAHFPFPDMAQKVLDTYFVEDGIPKGAPFKGAQVFSVKPSDFLISLTICANFAFVWLAKEGHGNPVSINYLEKISMPHLYAIVGAMMADVDFITMGAGIPLQIPEVIDALSEGRTATYRVPVIGRNITSYEMSFNPENFFGEKLFFGKRPGFIPIVASNLLASIFVKKLPKGSVYGFVVEEPTAGGHNAPPRKGGVYGPKDEVDYQKIGELGLPFWIGGAKASPEKLAWALSVGAKGIQAGSIFALCEESGMDPKIRAEIRRQGFEGTLRIRTDMSISPTGFPFKVAVLDGTISERSVYEARARKCDQCALVSLYEKADGAIGYRCPGEPVERFVLKGGKIEETVGIGCICNGLISTAGLGDGSEPALVTLGDDVSFLRRIMTSADSSYSAEDAIRFLLQ